MAVSTEPITKQQVIDLLEIARRERDAMVWIGVWTTLAAGIAGAVACFGLAELFHRRYAGEIRVIRFEVERQMGLR